MRRMRKIIYNDKEISVICYYISYHTIYIKLHTKSEMGALSIYIVCMLPFQILNYLVYRQLDRLIDICAPNGH